MRGRKIAGVGTIMGSISIVSAHFSVQSYLDSSIPRIVREQWYVPSWVQWAPYGKTKTLDAYIEEMKNQYTKLDVQRNTEAFDRTILYARTYAPDRLSEVYLTIIHFLRGRGDLNLAKQYLEESSIAISK